MQIETQEINGNLHRKEGQVRFAYDSHEQLLTLILPRGLKWSTLKTWLELLEDRPDTNTPPRELPEKPPRWASCKDAAKHYRVSMSTVHHWGASGRIRRKDSGRIHGRTKTAIWVYDVSHLYTNVPPKGTYPKEVK